MNTDRCPHCGSSQQGEEIPAEVRRFYGGDGTHYSRTILVEVRGVYDGGLYYLCPDCNGRWHRWPEGHDLRVHADKYVNHPEEVS